LDEHQSQQVSKETSPKSQSGARSTQRSPIPQQSADPSHLTPAMDTNESQPQVVATPEGTHRDQSKSNGNPSLEELCERAGTLHLQGRYEEALAIYAFLDKEAPKLWSKENLSTMMYNAASTAAKLNRSLECIEWCDKMLSITPLSPEALRQRGEAFSNLFEFSKAAADFEQLARVESEDEEIWLRRSQRARLKQQKLDDLYAVLRIDSLASASHVRKAYHEASRKWHPDKNQESKDDIARATIMFKAISQAHYTLSDATRRAQYDESRTRSARSAPPETHNHSFASSVAQTDSSEGEDSDDGENFARNENDSSPDTEMEEFDEESEEFTSVEHHKEAFKKAYAAFAAYTTASFGKDSGSGGPSNFGDRSTSQANRRM
jgi:curved DNA-binding protein CbpA